MGSFPFKDTREDGYFSVGLAEPKRIALEACQEPGEPGPPPECPL